MLISTVLFLWLSGNSFASCGTRVSHSSFGLHHNCSSCLSSPAHTIYPDSFLPGPFSCLGTQPRHSFVSYPDSYRPPPRTTFPDFLDFVFLGEHFRTDLGLVFPPEEKLLALRQFILTFLAKPCHCSSIFTTARSSQL